MARIDPSAPQQPTALPTSGPASTLTPTPVPRPKGSSKKEPPPLAPPSDSGWWVEKRPFRHEGKLYQPGHPVPKALLESFDPAYRDHLLQNWLTPKQDVAGRLFHRTVKEASEQPVIDTRLLESPLAAHTSTNIRSDMLLRRLSAAKNPEEQKALVHEVAKEVGLDLRPYRTHGSEYNTADISIEGVGKLLQAVSRTKNDITDVVKHLDETDANTLLTAHAMVNLHADAEAQLRHAADTGEKAGDAWYVDDVDAMEAGLHHTIMTDPKFTVLRPKIGAVDETGRYVGRHDPLSNPTMGLLKVLVGITSGGNTPKMNLGVALSILEQTLRDPHVLAGQSPFLHLSEKNLERFNEDQTNMNWAGRPGPNVTVPKLKSLVGKFGEAGALKWLMADHGGHEIKYFGGKGTLPDGINGTYAGSYIFGQKLGPFIQNLFRRSTELTADRWFTRTWHRIMGTLVHRVTEKGKSIEEVNDTPSKKTKRLMKLATNRVAASLGLSVSSLQAVLWYYEKRLWRAAGIANPEESYADAVEQEIQRRGLPAFRRPRRTPDRQGPNADAPSAKPVPLYRRRGTGPLRPRPRPPSRYAAPIQAPGKSAIAWSPNVEENLDFGAAWDRMRSGNHKAFGQIADHVLKTVGLGDYKSHAAVGDWSDGAENSFAHVLSGQQDPKKVEYAASWLGLLANQKAVLAFHAADDGADRLYSINVKGTDATRLRKGLDAAGLKYRTLVPTKDGFHILIYDEGAKSAPAIEQFAEAHDASVLETAGSGSFIGAGTRSEARHAYRQRIDAYEAEPNSSRYRPPVRGADAAPRPQSVYQMRRAGQPIRYAQVRAPEGGIVVRGVFYPGGKFIPTSEIEKAAPEERQALEQKLGASPPQKSAQAPSQPQANPLSSRLQALSQAAASVPPAVAAKAKALIQARYQKLVGRYGPKGAAAVLVATALLTPVPVPGTSLLPVAIAEGIKLAKAALSSRRLKPARLARRDDLGQYGDARSWPSDLRDAQEGYQAHLLANPLDHAKRLEYADVLEEQGRSELAARQRTMVERLEAMDERGQHLIRGFIQDAHARLTNPYYESSHAERIYDLARHHASGIEHWRTVKERGYEEESPRQVRVHEWLRDHFEALEPQTHTKGILKLARRVRYSMGGPTSDTDTEGSQRGPTTSGSESPTSDSRLDEYTRKTKERKARNASPDPNVFFSKHNERDPEWRTATHKVSPSRSTFYVQSAGSGPLYAHKIDWANYNHEDTARVHLKGVKDTLYDPKSYLPPEQRDRYHQSVSSTVSKLPPVAMARLHSHMSRYRFAHDPADLYEQASELYPEAITHLTSGDSIGGIYHPEHGVILDGDISGLDEEPHVKGNTEGVHAHELGHAIDGYGSVHALSQSSHWRHAWNHEIADGQLSRYATTTPAEGFAEFTQALYASELKPEQIQSMFPHTSYLFKEWGLWPGSAHPNDKATPARPVPPAPQPSRRRPR